MHQRLTELHYHSSCKGAQQSASLSLADQLHCTVYLSQQPNSLESYIPVVYACTERNEIDIVKKMQKKSHFSSEEET